MAQYMGWPLWGGRSTNVVHKTSKIFKEKKRLVQLIWNSFQYGSSGFPVKQGLLHRLSEAESTIEQMNAKLHQLEKNKQKIQSELGRYILN
jgi:hypothetical protein